MADNNLEKMKEALNNVSMPEETRQQILQAVSKIDYDVEVIRKKDTVEKENGRPEGEEDCDFKGMTMAEIAEEINSKGFKMSELSAINSALAEEKERREAEYRKESKKDWMKFHCHDVDTDFAIPISGANNYDGRFYSRARCEIEARRLLRDVYEEAKDIISEERLYKAALDEIVDFAEERFETAQITSRYDYIREEGFVLDEYLDIRKFKEEVADKLKGIRTGQLKSFEYYYQMVEYEDVNGDWDGLAGFFEKLKVSWNYNGYEAYLALEEDTMAVASKYADDATKIARSALQKRVEWLEELKKTG